MRDKLRSWWIKKRYRKKKILEFNKPPEQATPLIPVVVVDGDEEKTGEGDIEISFKHVNQENDLMLSVTPAEQEIFDLEDKNVIYWYANTQLKGKDHITLYYGCKNRWARLLDQLFIEEIEETEDSWGDAVHHLT